MYCHYLRYCNHLHLSNSPLSMKDADHWAYSRTRLSSQAKQHSFMTLSLQRPTESSHVFAWLQPLFLTSCGCERPKNVIASQNSVRDHSIISDISVANSSALFRFEAVSEILTRAATGCQTKSRFAKLFGIEPPIPDLPISTPVPMTYTFTQFPRYTARYTTSNPPSQKVLSIHFLSEFEHEPGTISEPFHVGFRNVKHHIDYFSAQTHLISPF